MPTILDAFPYYLSIGMTPEDYWRGDVWLTEDFERAHALRNQQKSEEMWLQGLYIYQAFAVALSNAFRKKGAPAQKYMTEPLRVIPLTEAEKAEQAEQERKRVIEYFNNLQKKWDRAKCCVPSAERRH